MLEDRSCTVEQFMTSYTEYINNLKQSGELVCEEEKLTCLQSIAELQGKLYPPALNQSGLDLSEESLKVSPWVNNVHSWCKLLNFMNAVNAMQSEEEVIQPQLVFAIARELYIYTTIS